MDEISKFYEPIKQAQDANNAWSAEQAQKAMDYQTQMSNTAHQREVADLKAAGLNPVLSAGGAGASTTSGVAASAGQENITAMYGLMAKAFQAQIDQAEAMKVSAQAISGSSGSSGSNPVPASENKDSSWFSSSGLKGLVQDILKRKLGISYETSEALFNTIGDFADLLPRGSDGKVDVDKIVSDAGNYANLLIKNGLDKSYETKEGKAIMDGLQHYSDWNEQKRQFIYSIYSGVKNAVNSAKNALSSSSSSGSKYHTGNNSSGRGGKFKSGSVRKNYKYSD